MENRLEIHVGDEDGNITTMFNNSSIDFSIDFEFPVVSMTSNSDDQIIYWIDTRGMGHFNLKSLSIAGFDFKDQLLAFAMKLTRTITKTEPIKG